MADTTNGFVDKANGSAHQTSMKKKRLSSGSKKPSVEQSLARLAAVDARLDQLLFPLESEHYDAFVQMLDNPPTPGPKLRALLSRVPVWEN